MSEGRHMCEALLWFFLLWAMMNPEDEDNE